MEKKYKILLAGVGAVLVLTVLGALFLSRQSKTPNPSGPATSTPANLPDYTLSAEEEKQMSEFVQNFASLYNTYSKEDLTNFQALGDYESSDMQNRSDELINQLAESLPDGYEKLTAAKAGTFRYSYPDGDTIIASVDVSVTETGTGSYDGVATLNLFRYGNRWYVNSIQYSQ